jgi:hypothetical protein
MVDRTSKESPGEQYRRLAEACLEMVPSIQPGEGRDALIEMARVWLRLAESYDKSIASAASNEPRPVMQQQQQQVPQKKDDEDPS